MTSGGNEAVKVLYVAIGLGTGGAERSAVDLAEPLKRNGIDIVFHVRSRRDTGAQKTLGADLIIGESSSFLGWVRELRQAIKQLQPDVVHTTLFEADIAGRLAAIGLNTKVISSVVNMSYEPARLRDPSVSRFRLEVVRKIESWTGRRFNDRFHALTHAVADSAVEHLHYPRAKIDVVPRARDIDRLGEWDSSRRQRTREALGVNEDDVVVLTVGRQEYQKAQEILLQAVPKIIAAEPTARFLMVGRDGTSTPLLKQTVADLKLEGSVQWLGHRDDVGDIMCAADLFVFPSRFEGLGGVLIEAMWLRLPIVASDIPPIREVLEGTSAWLCPPDEPAELASAICDAIADPARRARSHDQGPETVMERYTMDQVAPAMAEMYRSVASATP